jgi:outer membrane protein assembly factor BamA
MSSADARTLVLALALALPLLAPRASWAQDSAAQPPPPSSRTALIEQSEAEKATQLKPYEPSGAERIINNVEASILTGSIRFHPYFESAYAGGGFTLGAGYRRLVSAYNSIDIRGSLTVKGYKRVEGAFMAPRLFDRRGTLTVIGGWRDATRVGFYGTGINTSINDRVNYRFTQPYGTATLDVRPMRNLLLLHGGLELSRWDLKSGEGDEPSIDTVYTPETLPGLGTSTTYRHSDATVALDSRPAPDYARRGGYYGISFHDFHDQDGRYGFRRTDYEVIQHVPILRETWVLSLHGELQLANAANHQTVPFFMLPSLGGGSSLRGFASWRFRDLNSLLLSADWRVIANRFIDVALLYDAGRVAAHRSDLTSAPLKSDYGVGFRFHGPMTTPLRIDVAHGNEGLNLVFSAKAAF